MRSIVEALTGTELEQIRTAAPAPALKGSPGARAYHDSLRKRGTSHQAALRQLGNLLVGILHGCLKTNTLYNEHTAWGCQTQPAT
jgi:hypothetical protein